MTKFKNGKTVEICWAKAIMGIQKNPESNVPYAFDDWAAYMLWMDERGQSDKDGWEKATLVTL